MLVELKIKKETNPTSEVGQSDTSGERGEVCQTVAQLNTLNGGLLSQNKS